MMRTTWTVAAVLAAALGLSACGDRPQTLGASGVKQDSPAYQGVGASQYAKPGWQAGDRNSWEQHLRARAAYGQHEYSRSTQ